MNLRNTVTAALWSLLVATLACACESKAQTEVGAPTLTPFPPDIYIGLADSAAPFAELVAGPYQAYRQGSVPRFALGNDEILLRDLQAGLLEAVIVHHLPADSQVWFSPVALDGLQLIAQSEINIASLSREQVQEIFAGSTTNWSVIGGPDIPIKLYSREEGAGSRSTFDEKIMGNLPLSGLAKIAPSDEIMQRDVAENPGAIGYTMMATATESAAVPFEAMVPSPDTVSQQIYPLSTPLYFVSRSEPSGELREFLAWLQSVRGQEVVSENYGRVR